MNAKAEANGESFPACLRVGARMSLRRPAILPRRRRPVMAEWGSGGVASGLEFMDCDYTFL